MTKIWAKNRDSKKVKYDWSIWSLWYSF